MVIAFSVSFHFYFLSILKSFFDTLVMSREHQEVFVSRRFKGKAMAKQWIHGGLLGSGRIDSEIQCWYVLFLLFGEIFPLIMTPHFWSLV